MKNEISLLNEILATAAIYGGDSGGIYGTCKKDLEKAVDEWLKEKKLEDKYILQYVTYESKKGDITSNVPRLIRKEFAF
jgi:hypothetical protein